MRRPRLRFTVRWLMIAVAIIALSISSVRWVVEMRARSIAHYQRAEDFVVMTMRSGSLVTMPDGRVIDRYEDENDRIIDAWALPLARKYRRLSHYPWLPVEPDPPLPKLLDHPKSAFDLPAKVRTYDLDSEPYWARDPRPPAWTFLWTQRL
jgi:hypothetical protein